MKGFQKLHHVLLVFEPAMKFFVSDMFPKRKVSSSFVFFYD